MSDTFKDQLKAVITDFDEANSQAEYHDLSDIFDFAQRSDLETRCITAIERVSGKGSTYVKEIQNVPLASKVGVAKALLSDMENGYTETFEELAHGDVFGDFLEMADYLVGKGYKDAAAVLAGGTLEVHLKNLCTKHGIATTLNGKPKKAESMNVELSKGKIYTALEQKQVTAWLGLRNHAAHGKYEEYDKNRVRLLVDGVRDFIIRYPA